MNGIHSFKARGDKPHVGWPNKRHKKEKETLAERNLSRRIGDWMKNLSGMKLGKSGRPSYHKPGSNKK